MKYHIHIFPDQNINFNIIQSLYIKMSQKNWWVKKTNRKALLVYTETKFQTESYRVNLGFKAP